jgi:NodT family efflux transporter outer membrane factor (OMF) lipoprotein
VTGVRTDARGGRTAARATAWAALALSAVSGAACATGPPYKPPEVTIPPSFKEADGWKPAQPRDETIRGKWWELFRDPQLNALEERLSVSNQTLKAAHAQFLQARALVGSARAARYPQAGAAASVTEGSTGARYTDYLLRVDVSYEVDVWRRVAHTVEASRASARASAADLEIVSLSLHGELAIDYFQLRALDTGKEILDSTVAAYDKALELTRNRYKGGIASAVDVALAETQLETTRAQAFDVDVQRAQFEHAIATLTGQLASTFSLPRSPLSLEAPAIPIGLPADVLERRPDIAAAERRMAAANAQVGFAASAFYPVVALTGAAGLESASLGDWLKAASNFWSFAPAAAVAVFDGGRRRAVSEQARAAYDQTVAMYRDTVLSAFQEVEDSLAALRILAEEARTQETARAAAQRSLMLATSRYKGGVTTYLEVVVAQSAALANQQAAVNILMRRLTASVLLIKALGGGWDLSKLPAL